ncbi:MAG TPA: alpha-amylase [Cellvibrionales bacterium]|nr:alpha-amylase [Cellvibrionales bacterium]
MPAQKLLKLLAFFFFSTLLPQSLWANTDHHKITAHAPIGVMGDHMHKTGEWMFSYRYMSMSMEDNLQGSNNISPEGIRDSGLGLRVVPLQMTTDMHMFGAMYAPSDKLTLMLMVNYVEKEMDHLTFMMPMGPMMPMSMNETGVFTTKTSGIGDTKIGALYSLRSGDNTNIHLNLGLSIPTGKIDYTDQILTPMNTTPSPRLPYPMQLGSGTYDIQPGITYAGTRNSWDWGSQVKMIIRLDDNDEGYSLGDQTQVTSWGGYRFTHWLTGSLRLTYTHADEISGKDALINLPVQTSNPDNFGGERIDLGVGITLIGSEGAQKGHRLALEYETTIDQDVNGIQMEMQDMLTIGYQFSL